MTKEKINTDKEKPLILLAPLDWGLGHTTRCIPLIQELLSLSCQIVVACNPVQKELLQQEFPLIGFLYLPGYNMKYGSHRVLTLFRIIFQIPKMLIKIKNERKWLLETVKKYPVRAVISDNRYGMYHSHLPSILITHQLSIRSGLNKWTDSWIQRKIYGTISKFTECWVPDTKGKESLAGELSNPLKMPPIPVRYLGNISRFMHCSGDHAIKRKILIVLSGPEPQRTKLEKQILLELKTTNDEITIVRGIPDNKIILHNSEQVAVFDHLPAKDLNVLACQSEYIISRAGYTSVMDYLKLKKKMILVPTPGQAEQEYIASRLGMKKLALIVQQKDFSIRDSMKRAQNFPYEFVSNDMEEYKKVLKNFITDLT